MRTGRPRAGTAEWVTFAVAASILVALAGAITWTWVQHRDPPAVTISQLGDARITGGQRYVTAKVNNAGDETAQAVHVIAGLSIDGAVVAESDQQIDDLSGGETEEVVFVFDAAAPGQITLRVASFAIP